jgi:hypothetical protein
MYMYIHMHICACICMSLFVRVGFTGILFGYIQCISYIDVYVYMYIYIYMGVLCAG